MRPTFKLRGDGRTVEITWNDTRRTHCVFTSARELLAFAGTIELREPDRYEPAPDRAVWLRHREKDADVHVTRTGRITARRLLDFAQRAVAGDGVKDSYPTAEGDILDDSKRVQFLCETLSREALAEQAVSYADQNVKLHHKLTAAHKELAQAAEALKHARGQAEEIVRLEATLAQRTKELDERRDQTFILKNELKAAQDAMAKINDATRVYMYGRDPK